MINLNQKNTVARLAGFIYLLVVISGIFSLMYVPKKLIVWGDSQETTQKISSNLYLFKLGIVSEILMLFSFIFLLLALYKLLHKVNKYHAVSMVVIGLVSIALNFSNMVTKFSILTLVEGRNYLSQISATQIEAITMFHVDSYYHGINLSQVFWGLWLFPFGYLVFKSGFLPKFLGFFLMLGCFGYIIAFIGNLFIVDYNKTLFAEIVSIPDSIGELGICLWLLIMDTNQFKFSK
ncbi:DUF4386 domain-containing protein [Tenacibaculum agarivorans]|uniref:DUF4386 domain-containing protein n=1 Tax=Tenacibaculum agarivorans TaxID=1908389 RepID=UPI00094B8161|nr:DUF4386 domain-containing protein [Tenacibaculum agarivorans]